MAKKTKVRDYDQFIVRLPDGMRDRIKAKAERAGMSMNEAIVWCLDRFFPAPATLEEKIDQLARLVAMLRHGGDVEGRVDKLIEDLDDALRDIGANRIKAPKDFRQRVYERVADWDIAVMEDESDPFDDRNYLVTRSDGSPVDEPFEDPFPDDSAKDRS
jgi:hypothetical protein